MREWIERRIRALFRRPWTAADDLRHLARKAGGIYELGAKLLEQRIVLLCGVIDDRLSTLVIAQLLFLEAEDSAQPIELWINSPGGHAVASLAIADTMAGLNAAVWTYCLGHAGGTAAMLLICGTAGHRLADPAARIALVDVELEAGRPFETSEEMWALHRVRRALAQRIANGAGQALGAVLDGSRAGVALSALEARTIGMTDGIRAVLPGVPR